MRCGETVVYPLLLVLLRLPIFAGMPQPQDINHGFLELVAHLVFTDKDAAHLARLELFQPLADARIGQQANRCGGQRFHSTCSSGRIRQD